MNNKDAKIHWIELDTKDSGIEEMGGHTAILPKNEPDVVGRVLKLYNYDGNQVVNIMPVKRDVASPFPTSLTVYELLAQYLDFQAAPTQTFLSKLSRFITKPDELKLINKLLNPDTQAHSFHKFCKENNYEETLKTFSSAQLTLAQLLTLMPLTKPRLYTLETSFAGVEPEKHPTRRQHVIYAHVFKTPKGKVRKGLCSHYICSLPEQSYVAFRIDHCEFGAWDPKQSPCKKCLT